MRKQRQTSLSTFAVSSEDGPPCSLAIACHAGHLPTESSCSSADESSRRAHITNCWQMADGMLLFFRCKPGNITQSHLRNRTSHIRCTIHICIPLSRKILRLLWLSNQNHSAGNCDRGYCDSTSGSRKWWMSALLLYVCPHLGPSMTRSRARLLSSARAMMSSLRACHPAPYHHASGCYFGGMA